MKDIKPLDFKIDPKSALPVYEQIKQEIKLLIISGYLESGDRMMPIRDMAKMLLVNTNTIVKVYYQLDIEGFLDPQPGSGYFVKFDSNDNAGVNRELFENITGDYISRALQLGYSLADMDGEIKRRMKKGGGKKEKTRATAVKKKDKKAESEVDQKGKSNKKKAPGV